MALAAIVKSAAFSMWWRGSSGITWPASRPRVLSVSRWFMKTWADFAFTNMWTSVWRRWRRNQWRVHVPPTFEWPLGFTRAHLLGWAAIILLAATGLLDLLARRRDD
jgi:hypothetical protein